MAQLAQLTSSMGEMKSQLKTLSSATTKKCDTTSGAVGIVSKTGVNTDSPRSLDMNTPPTTIIEWGRGVKKAAEDS